MGTNIIPLLPMRKLKLRVVYTLLKLSQLPRTAGELTWVHLIWLIPLRNRTLGALIAILPVEKADPFIQLSFSTCRYAVSCLSHNKHASY